MYIHIYIYIYIHIEREREKKRERERDISLSLYIYREIGADKLGLRGRRRRKSQPASGDQTQA